MSGDGGAQAIGIPYVALDGDDVTRQARCSEQTGVGGRRQCIAVDISAKPQQPQTQPATLETCVAGDENLFALPESAVYCQTFHGAFPEVHNSLSKTLSRSVSSGSQNPVCT